MQDAETELMTWLVGGAGPPAGIRVTIERAMQRILDAGVPLHMFSLFVLTHHPIVGGKRIRWTPEDGARIDNATYQFFSSDMFLKSPIRRVFDDGITIRRRFFAGDPFEDYDDFRDYLADGVTDYYAQPLIYLGGETHGLSWVTRDPAGFSDAQIAMFDRIVPAMARLIEIYLLKINSQAYLTTFLGRDPGTRVLDGNIHRGESETIDAVILFADLAGFTQMSNAEPPARVLERLNGFYDAVCGPVVAEGGEILKFIGDEVLAIFPVADPGARAARASAALDAIAAAQSADDVPPFRAAVHLGALTYGNIGAQDRLDFTAIGPAVNLTARLLSQAGAGGHRVVASRRIAELLPARITRTYDVPMKGFDAPQAVGVVVDGAIA